MRGVRSLLWFALGFVLVAVPMFAFAAMETIPATQKPYSVGPIVGWRIGSGTVYYATAQAACNAARPDKPLPHNLAGGWRGVQYYCNMDGITNAFTVSKVCPSTGPNQSHLSDESTWYREQECFGSGTSYVCPVDALRPWTLNGTTCERPLPCETGSVYSSGYYDIGASPKVPAGGTVACGGGCELVLQGSVAARSLVSGEYRYFFQGEYQRTGGTCSGATAMPSGGSVPSDTCGAGQGSATMNGKTVCVDMTTGEPNDPNPTPAPKTTTTETTKVTNPDGSETTTETTTRPDGSTTVKTTTTNADGSSSSETVETPGAAGGEGGINGEGSEGVEDPMKGFCEQNPDASICKQGEGTFEGSCGAFVCEGDAVECAAAKAVSELNCAYRPSDGGTLAERIAAGADPQAASMPWAAGQVTTTSVSGMLDTSEHFGATCPADLAFSIGGRSVNVSLANACTWLGWIGNIMLAGCLVAGLGIALGRTS